MSIEPGVAPAALSEFKHGVPLGYVFAATGVLLFSTKAIIVKLAYAMGVDPETLLGTVLVLVGVGWFTLAERA